MTVGTTGPSAPPRPPSPEALALLARGERILAALQPVEAMQPPAPEPVRAAAAGLARELQRLRSRLTGGRVEVGLFGLPKAGKSTMLNALAGRQVSATDILPETAFPIYLVPVTGAAASNAPASGPAGDLLPAKVYFHPELKRPPLELPAEDLGKISREKSIWNPREVAFAEVPCRTEVLAPGFCFIDTPGLEEFVRDYGDSADRLLNDETDAAVLVATPDQAMRDTIRRFLELAARRCPRLWIAVNCDLTAATLRPDGTREVTGTAEFERMRERFTAKYAEIKGLALMFREGAAALHFFSAKAAKDKRFAGAGMDALSGDPAVREFASLAAQARTWADDPARERHVVKFQTGRLRECALETAEALRKAAEPLRAEHADVAATLRNLQARRDEEVKLETRLREVIDSAVADAGDALRTIAVDALQPFFATPLRQAAAGWYRAKEPLLKLHQSVKDSLRSEMETVRLKLRAAAADRAGKLGALLPERPAGVPEPVWIHPVYADEPPAALVGDLKRLPVVLGRAAGIGFLIVAGAVGGLVNFFVSFLVDSSWLYSGIAVGGAIFAWQFVKFRGRRQLLTRPWSGWAKRFFLPGDAEHIRAIYEEDIRNHLRVEAGAGAEWLKQYAGKLLAGHVRPESEELKVARAKEAHLAGRLAVIDAAATELHRRAEEGA